MLNFIKHEIINLKSNPEYNEKWLQGMIEQDPSILGLGDLEFRNTEKILVGGGRLDTLLYDPENKKRYEVEIQLGKTDETHIIRTIEYWDIERKRNPQYEHCAVLIAEDITSRFLNVISLFNGFIPLIALQVKAIKIKDNVTLIFTKILDEVKFDLLDEDISQEVVDLSYWKNKSNQESLNLVDKIMNICSESTNDFTLKFTKHYIGLTRDIYATNFISFIPRKSGLIFQIRLERNEEIDNLIDTSNYEMLSYDQQFKLYKLKIFKKDLEGDNSLLKELVKKAKEEYKYF